MKVATRVYTNNNIKSYLLGISYLYLRYITIPNFTVFSLFSRNWTPSLLSIVFSCLTCSCIFCSCFLHTSKIKPATFSLQLCNVLRTYTYTFHLRLPLPIKHIIITVYINLQSSLFSWNWTPSLLRIIILPSFCSCFFNIFSYSF